MTEFEYINAKSLLEASKIATANSNSLLYGGGTDALSLLKKDIYIPEKVINLKNIPNLEFIKYDNNKGLKIGALTKIADISSNDIIKEKFNVLHEAAMEIASPQLRNMGTLGGNLCQRPRCWYYRDDFDCIRKGGSECFAYDGRNKYHCVIGGGPCYIVHPSDMAVALSALDAKVTIYSEKKGERTLSLDDFFVLPEDDSMAENILRPGDILKEITVDSVKANLKSGYVKFKERNTWDFAIVSVGAAIKTSGNKIIDGKIAFGGIAPKPWIEKEFNGKLKGLEISENSIEEAVGLILKNAVALRENGYKIPLTRNLTKRLLLKLGEG